MRGRRREGWRGRVVAGWHGWERLRAGKPEGVEAARIMLGHHSIPRRELYAERDGEVADRVAKAIG